MNFDQLTSDFSLLSTVRVRVANRRAECLHWNARSLMAKSRRRVNGQVMSLDEANTEEMRERRCLELENSIDFHISVVKMSEGRDCRQSPSTRTTRKSSFQQANHRVEQVL